MKQLLRLSPGLRRSTAVLAVTSVLVAGVVVIDLDNTGGVGLSALPGATGQPAPTGPTGGGSGGGSGNGPAFPMQPPDMPSGPPNGYNSGSYPAPDQGNGISIYNSGAPESPGSQGGYQQGSNNPQQLQPANGSQPPNYDAPLQTAAQPSVAPTQAPHSAAQQQPQPSQVQQPEPSQVQQQPSQEPQDNQQSGQRQTQCQQAAAQLAAQSAGSAVPSGGGRGLILGGFGRDNRWKLDPPPPSNPSCPNCPPTTAKQLPPEIQNAIHQEVQQQVKEATKCTWDTYAEDAGAMVAGFATMIVGAFTAPLLIGWVAIGGGAAATGVAYHQLLKCGSTVGGN